MIYISKPYFDEKESEAVTAVIKSGWVTQGPRVQEFEEKFAEYVRSPYACAVSNCTTALHLALLAVGVKPGNIVVTVSHSFIATSNCIRHCQAEPYFIDIEKGTYNISPVLLKQFFEEKCENKGRGFYLKDIKALTTEYSPLRYIKTEQKEFGKVAAVLIPHQIGFPCDLKSILDLTRQVDIPLVEDAACCIGSEISFDQHATWEKIGKPHGDIACFSFNPRKILTTGDGGMIVTQKKEIDEKFRLLRHQGMNV